MKRLPIILLILTFCLGISACGLKHIIGLGLFGKDKYQVAENMNATGQIGVGNKNIGQNTTNNDTTLMIIINAFLILVIIIQQVINALRNIRQEKRYNKLVNAIYHNPELVVKNVKIKEEEKV